jgi:outer membrane receptor for ferrienterochelin and colicins
MLLSVLAASAAERLVDRSLEELMTLDIPVVSTASKFSQKANEAPASVSVITAKDIKQFGYRTLGDALNSQAGMYIQYDRLYQEIGIRGFQRAGEYNNRVAFLLNGARTNDPVYNIAPIGQDFYLDLDLIDRIELIRGASSSLYGNNAVYGVVNVITKRGRDIDGVEASTHGGSFGTYGGRVTAGKKFANGFEALVSGSFEESDGNKTLNFPGLGTASKLDYSRRFSLFGTFTYGDFTLEAAHSERERGIPTAAYETLFNDHRTQLENDYTVASLKYEKIFEGDVSFLSRVQFLDYNYRGVYPYGPLYGLNTDLARGSFGSLEILVGKKLWNTHQLTIGLEGRKTFNADQHSFYVNPDSVYIDDHRSETEFAAFVQGDFELHRALKLNIGARFDKTKRGGGVVSPRVGFVWTPTEGTTFKAVAGQAFRAPSAYEAYYYNSLDENEHETLGRESTQSLELIWEQKLASNWQMKMAAYNGRAEDLAQYVVLPDGDPYFTNSLHAEFRGIEAELHGRFGNGIDARVSYSVQKTVNSESGARLSNSPQHLAKLHLSAPLIGEKLGVALEVLASSSAATVAGNTEGAFCVANLHFLSANVLPGLEVSAGVYNLFDQHYAHPSSGDHPLVDRIEQDGRTFGVKATYKF